MPAVGYTNRMDESAAQPQRLGPYLLGERLGFGGMAEVFVATRPGPHGFNKRFAVKRILPELARDPRFVAMFCDEARICASLSHPNIVEVIDFGESDGEVFMALEYVDGISLAKLLRMVAGARRRFPVPVALFMAHELLRALDFAHTACDEMGRPLGIVHRDVSPGNVLIGRTGEVKLGDFGILLSSFVDRRTHPGELKGKIGYMSPEQAMGSAIDPRSDLFAVGIVLSEMLLARPLFSGKNEFEILTKIHDADLSNLDKYGHTVPTEVMAIVRTALAREPSRRYASAAAFALAIQSATDHLGLPAAGAPELVSWLSAVGALPSRSGTMPVQRVEDYLPPVRTKGDR
jgi:eukaryotic-like serine/threonine-protein kinase